mgnify:CR=1 FL=1
MSIQTAQIDESVIVQYSEKKAAALLGLSPKTLQKYRIAGGGPKFVHVSGRCIRYRLCDLKTWQESLLRNSTSDPGPAEASAPRRARRVK